MEDVLPDGLNSCVGLVVHTNLPVTWHFVDNLCGFCVGCRGIETTDIWLRRFFDDMGIDPGAKPEIKENSMGQEKWHYPNPFIRYITPALTTNNREVLCAPWPNLRYGFNGQDYLDFHTKKKNGKYVDCVELQTYNKRAKMSACFFFKSKLHELSYSILCARAKKFCEGYPNNNGQYHQVGDIQYLDLGVWTFWQAWDQDVWLRKYFPNEAGKKPVNKVKVELEEIGNSI